MAGQLEVYWVIIFQRNPQNCDSSTPFLITKKKIINEKNIDCDYVTYQSNNIRIFLHIITIVVRLKGKSQFHDNKLLVVSDSVKTKG